MHQVKFEPSYQWYSPFTSSKFSSPKKCFKFLTCIRRTKTGSPYLLRSRLTLHPPIPILELILSLGFLVNRLLLVTGGNMILSQRNTVSLGLHDSVLGQMIYFLICNRKLTQKESFLLTSQLDHLQFLLGNVWKERSYGRQRKGEALFRLDPYSLDMQVRKLTLSINQVL